MYEPVILRNVGIENSWDIDVYTERGGYRQAPKALGEYDPGGLIDLVKQSGLRGRGGAGLTIKNKIYNLEYKK
jgi:NADH-quinone oxidoreductase subunit F